MQPDRRDRISDLHHAALARAPHERAAFLAEACVGDEDLRREVESLLAYEGASERFLETPVAVVASALAGPDDRSLMVVGHRFGPYTILAPLGAGGMGEVYRARDSRLGREVAIKLLPSHFTADPERRARFAREARLLATLNHPHVGAIYAVEEIEGVKALVLELVEGPSLAERLSHGPLAMREALALARQIADALDAAHQRGIVHRDLKPANVIVQRQSNASGVPSGDVRAKVLDFGLAKTLSSSVAEPAGTLSSSPLDTGDGRILGTPAYMSPEQVRGQAIDKRTDVWAFGCVLYEMLAGRPAFEGATISDTFVSVLEREPDWNALPAATPATIRTLLQRCLRKDLQTRLHDIADARIEIDECELALPAAAVETRGGRRRAWIAAVLLVCSSLAAIVVVLLRMPQPASEPFEFPVGPPGNTIFPSRYGGFAVAPDGRQLVVTASADNRSSLWVRPINAPQYRQLLGTEGALFPFWRPDGSEIGFFAGGKLKTIAVRGGIPNIVCEAPEIPEGSEYDEIGGTWNRDDTIVFMSRAFTLQKVSARAGSVPVPITALGKGETAHRWPSFLPDGRHFLYLALGQSGEPGDLRTGSLDGGPGTSLGRFESTARYSAGHLLFLRRGQLVARRFDPSSRSMAGPVVPVVPTSRFNTWHSLGAFSVSESGVLAHHPGGPIVAEQRLAWRDRAGRVTGSVGEPGRYPTIDLSPDGQRVAAAFVRGAGTSDIWIIDLARGDGVPLTGDPAWEFDPSWSHDARHIVFNSNRSEGRVNLFMRASDGSGQDELVVAAMSTAETPVWSPRDRSLVYTDDGDLWTRQVGSDPKASVLWKTAARERAGSLSPDGRWIAYTSDKSGRQEIYARAFPSGDVEHKVSVDGGMASRWRADGRELFFLSLDATMMAARVATARGLKTAMPEPLFATGLSLVTLRPYAVARDGQRFLIPMAVDGGGTPPITVVLNWHARIPN